jgi:hypothetical protein
VTSKRMGATAPEYCALVSLWTLRRPAAQARLSVRNDDFSATTSANDAAVRGLVLFLTLWFLWPLQDVLRTVALPAVPMPPHLGRGYYRSGIPRRGSLLARLHALAGPTSSAHARLLVHGNQHVNFRLAQHLPKVRVCLCRIRCYWDPRLADARSPVALSQSTQGSKAA